MDNIDALKAEIEDPKNREAISRLESEMQRYVVRKRKLILQYHAETCGDKSDVESYEHSIVRYFAVVDKCCINPDTESRIQLGRAMREVLSKLKKNEAIDIDDFIVACLDERNLEDAFAPFKEHLGDIVKCLTERDKAVEWRDDYMVTVALLFDRRKDHYVALLRDDVGATPSSD